MSMGMPSQIDCEEVGGHIVSNVAAKACDETWQSSLTTLSFTSTNNTYFKSLVLSSVGHPHKKTSQL